VWPVRSGAVNSQTGAAQTTETSIIYSTSEKNIDRTRLPQLIIPVLQSVKKFVQMGVLWDTAKFFHTHQNMELMKGL